MYEKHCVAVMNADDAMMDEFHRSLSTRGDR